MTNKNKTVYSRQQILDAYNSDDVTGIQTLVKKLGISRKRTLEYLDQYQITAERKPSRYKKEVPDEITLRQMYSTQSLDEIAKHFDVSSPTVTTWFNQYNIDKRDGKQARALSASKSSPLQSNPDAQKLFYDKQWCIRTFVEQRQPIQSVCNLYKVAGPTVYKILHDHGIFELIEADFDKELQEAVAEYRSGTPFTSVLAAHTRIQHSQLRELLDQDEIRTPNSYPRKFTKNSKQELLVESWLQEFGVEYQRSNRSILEGRELDFVIESRKLAIEVNGNLFHSELLG